MRRALLISYGFPPVSRVQSQGAAALARGLAARGWNVEVLTIEDPPTNLIDERLAAALPANVTVHTSWSLEPTRALQWARRVKGGAPAADTADADASGAAARATDEPSASGAQRRYTALPQWAVHLMRAAFLPDEKVGWTPYAVRAGRDLMRDAPFDVVISTGPPYTDHVIGRRIAKATGRPWLAVLMDPIVGCYAFPPATPLHADAMRRLERKVARDASAIAIATRPWADELVARNPEAADKVIVFPNGYEPADFDAPAPPPHDGFLISYVGTFQLSIQPDAFLEAMAALRDRGDLPSDLRARFVGPVDPRIEGEIARLGLGDLIERTGFVTHAEAVAQMRAADALLFLLGPEQESRGILTGKLPEYLAAGREILALAPEGVATDAIERAGAGLVVTPGDVDGTAAALMRLYELWRGGAPMSPDAAVVREFDRQRNLDALEGVVASLAETGTWRSTP